MDLARKLLVSVVHLTQINTASVALRRKSDYLRGSEGEWLAAPIECDACLVVPMVVLAGSSP